MITYQISRNEMYKWLIDPVANWPNYFVCVFFSFLFLSDLGFEHVCSKLSIIDSNGNY